MCIDAIAAVDPGRDKCGLAVMSGSGDILMQEVINTVSLEKEIDMLVKKFNPGILLLGNGTTSREAESRIREAAPALTVSVVDEHCTTEQARKEYWKVHPPKGIMRLIPVSMQVPPVPVDDFVAVILARRYLSAQSSVR